MLIYSAHVLLIVSLVENCTCVMTASVRTENLFLCVTVQVELSPLILIFVSQGIWPVKAVDW